MEVARLFDQDVFIAQEWFSQLKAGALRENIIRSLDDKYRIHSQKKVFVCPHCNQTVSLVLRVDSPHFRHEGDRCPSANNYTRYGTQVKSNEDELKHRAGRAIIRTYLEGQLRPHRVEVQDGYMCRTTLKVVPDFLLTFPDGSIWSIDYVTGTRQDESYGNFIKKRSAVYRAAGFKPVYLIDSSWLAEIPERSLVSFYLAESQMKTQNSIDGSWTEFVREFLDSFGESFVLKNWFGVSNWQTGDWEVYSLAYVDPSSGKAFIQRFIPAQTKIGYYVYRSSLSLEDACSLDETGTEFRWWEANETDRMLERLQKLSNAYERELAIQEEQERQRRMELEALKARTFSTPDLNLKLIEPDPHEETPYVSTDTQSFGDLESINFIDLDSVQKAFNSNLTAIEAYGIYQFLLTNRGSLPMNFVNGIRGQARRVMGPIKKPNYIDPDLRRILIDICFV